MNPQKHKCGFVGSALIGHAAGRGGSVHLNMSTAAQKSATAAVQNQASW